MFAGQLDSRILQHSRKAALSRDSVERNCPRECKEQEKQENRERNPYLCQRTGD